MYPPLLMDILFMIGSIIGSIISLKHNNYLALVGFLSLAVSSIVAISERIYDPHL